MNLKSYVTSVLALLACICSSLTAGCCSSEGCESKGITQHCMDKQHGTLILTKPGKYHLEQDVRGTIQIASDNVCLDLCCHTLSSPLANAIIVGSSLPQVALTKAKATASRRMIYSKDKAIADFLQKEPSQDAKIRDITYQTFAKKASSAFSLPSSKTIQHIRISNGSITGGSENAILVNSVFDMEVSNLTMQKNSRNAIHVVDSSAVTVTNIDFFGGGALAVGERALLLETTDNFVAKNLVVTGYTCTIGSAIELADCHTGTIENADVSLNTCSPSESLFYTPLGSFVTLSGCSEVDLNSVRVNNNTYKDPGITFFGIFLAESTSCSILDCEVCGNVDESSGTDRNFDGLFILFSDMCNVNGYKFNENRTINYMAFEYCGIVYCNSSYASCENVQISSNVAEDISWFNMHGIWTVNFFDGPSTNEITMRNCEISNNVTNGSSDGVTSYIAIRVNSSDNLLENCRMNSNTGYTEAAQFIQGFACSGGTNAIRLVNCQANLNDAPDNADYSEFPGAAACVGYNFHSGNVELIDSSASNNGNAGILTYNNIYVQCINCIFNENGTLSKKVIGAGLAIGAEALGGSGNITVRNSLIQNNGSASLTDEGYGIYVTPGNQNAISIEDTDIFATRGSFVSSGIYSDGTKNIVIKNVTVRDTNGVALLTDCTGISLSNATNALIENSNVLSTGSTSTQLFVTVDPPVLPPVAAVLTNASLPVTTPVTAAGALADPLNACTSLINDLTGKIGVMKWSWPSCAGSVTRVGRCVAAGDIATIIVQSNPTSSFTGSNAQVNCSVSELDGDALIDAITNNPGLELSIGYFPAASGVGIKFENVDVFEIAGTTSSSNADEGFLMIDSSNGVVQESKALSNGSAGFSDNQSTPALFNAYIENIGSKNNPNFDIGANVSINNISLD